jgi:hypothetical protein
MIDYIIVSYATEDKKYLNYANRFLNNLKKLDILNYDITYIKPFNSEDAQKIWNYKLDKIIAPKRLAALYKPTIILDKILQYKKMIIFMDIDAILTGKPNFSEIKNSFDVGITYKIDNNNNLPICDAVHVYNYTENAIRLLKSWKSFCDISNISYFGDHRRLNILINLFQEENKIFKQDFKLIDVTNIFKDIFKETMSLSNKSRGLRGAK